ncbi:hypothetical protein CRE_14662 [Caenorhabditis remanei]|uniref:Serpentine Receptor, class Z n=1 Tax=Caenorhabditis remanei TaxID=31234 RepID=E3M9E9_CAERE|nr:hypothetical protein CRE_14662 [Caenorhabditis remanei]
MSTTMNSSDLDKYDFYDEECGKWIHIQDYYESYNNYSKQHEEFTKNNTPIYPILRHFYRFSCLMMIIYMFSIILFSGTLLFLHDQIKSVNGILLFGGYYISIVVSPVFNIILILLAVQRFLLYFYEDSERFLNLKSFYWSVLVVFLYFSFAILHIPIRIKDRFDGKFEFINWLAFPTGAIENSLLENVQVYLSFILEFLAFISVVVYIPMFISIRKLLYLPSLAQSQPQKYIMYQVKFIFIGKLFMLIILVTSGLVAKFSGWAFSNLAFVIMNLSTFYMTPLIIQMTYLFCNKRNTQLVISYLSFRFVIDKLRRLLRKNNAVQPIVPTDYSRRREVA